MYIFIYFLGIPWWENIYWLNRHTYFKISDACATRLSRKDFPANLCQVAWGCSVSDFSQCWETLLFPIRKLKTKPYSFHPYFSRNLERSALLRAHRHKRGAVFKACRSHPASSCLPPREAFANWQLQGFSLFPSLMYVSFALESFFRILRWGLLFTYPLKRFWVIVGLLLTHVLKYHRELAEQVVGGGEQTGQECGVCKSRLTWASTTGRWQRIQCVCLVVCVLASREREPEVMSSLVFKNMSDVTFYGLKIQRLILFPVDRFRTSLTMFIHFINWII